MLVVDQVTSETVFYNFGWKIQEGTLSAELIRPVHPILTNALMNTLAFKALTTLVLIPIWITLLLLFKPTFDSVTLTNLLLTIPALPPGGPVEPVLLRQYVNVLGTNREAASPMGRHAFPPIVADRRVVYGLVVVRLIEVMK